MKKQVKHRANSARPCWVRYPGGRITFYATMGEARESWAEGYDAYTLGGSDEGQVYYRNPDSYPDPKKVPPPDAIIRMGRTAARIEGG